MLLENAERAERAAWIDLYRAAGLQTAVVGGGTVYVAPAIDHVLFNRSLSVPPRHLPDAVELFAAHGVERFLLHVGEHELDDALAATGLQRFRRPWGKLARTPGPVHVPACEVEIGLATPAEAEAVGALLCQGFDVPEVGIRAFAVVVGRPGWEVYVARDAGQVVGVGLGFDAAGGTSLVGGVTAPSHRRLGIQQAIMARRIAAAFGRGAAFVCSETGIAVPGEPNSSWNNMERCGLRQIAVREHLVPPDTAWSTDRSDRANPSGSSARGDGPARDGRR